MMHLLILSLFLLSLGCGTNYGQIPRAHIVMINAEGNPVDPTGNVSCEKKGESPCNGKHSFLFEYPRLSSDEYIEHLQAINQSLDKYKNRPGGKALHKILIFVHGGLNFQTETVERAAELQRSIFNDSDTYPIFINWQSSLFPSYGNHLFHIRQGEDWRQGLGSALGGYATSPVYLATDLARAVVRAPTVTFFQVRNDIETVPAFRPILSLWSSDLALAQEAAFETLCRKNSTIAPEYQNSPNEYKTLLGKQNSDCEHNHQPQAHELANINLWTGVDERTSWEKGTAFMKYIITLPTKLALAPFLDAFGTSSWDIMLRSVSQLFHYDGEQAAHTSLGTNHPDANDYKQSGALSIFFKNLKTQICDHPIQENTCSNSKNWEITLVGHSTGAIVLHHVIREFGELPIRNIVYMGAASTIRDYQDTLFPYLEAHNFESSPLAPESETISLNQTDRKRAPSKNPINVYHLMLHETAETGEWLNEIIDPTPRGSLLVWLDSFLSHPLSKEDRTLGRFTNFITAVHHIPQDLRPYIFATKFGVGNDLASPQKHGHFSHIKFWKSECWKPTGISKDCFNH